ITALPQSGNYFASWSGAGSGMSNPLELVVSNAHLAVTAMFQPLSAGQYALTALADGFGSVTSSPQANRFASGANVTLTATPDAGQQFLGWSGDASGTQTPLPVLMSSSKVITARFTRRPSL